MHNFAGTLTTKKPRSSGTFIFWRNEKIGAASGLLAQNFPARFGYRQLGKVRADSCDILRPDQAELN